MCGCRVGCHAVALWLPCRLLCGCRVGLLCRLLCGCRAVAVRLPCGCYVWLPCSRYVWLPFGWRVGCRVVAVLVVVWSPRAEAEGFDARLQHKQLSPGPLQGTGPLSPGGGFSSSGFGVRQEVMD
uniref:Secreted protein n=1 Tax=Knipowitschia caucasica TaxID=637954 RepID=A0AAV2KJ99_KNICA